MQSPSKLGEVSPSPPSPGQPYPPARNHPRWKELYRLHDEWLMKYWPFSSEQKRARIPSMSLAGFSTWCAPAADFDRMVWGARIAGAFFMADDYVDVGKMLDCVPGFKQVASGNGPLDPQDRAEICHDIVFRAIKATCHPRTFNQLTQCTHEWWDSHSERGFNNLYEYLALRRVNIAMYFANAYFRYTFDINLTDEQVNHPLMREAEGIVADHVGLVNDLFSYAKERLTNSDDTNILRLLQEYNRLTYNEAKLKVEKKIREKEQALYLQALLSSTTPCLVRIPKFTAGLLVYLIAWVVISHGRKRAVVITSATFPGGISFPKLTFAAEETPTDELVDDLLSLKILQNPPPSMQFNYVIYESPMDNH